MKLVVLFLLLLSNILTPQNKTNYQRLVKIVVDSTKLEAYKSALKEGTETSVYLEPGVISYNIYYEKVKPNHITIFETYSSIESYTKHVQTTHFKKYKSQVADMVQSLEIIDVGVIANVIKK